jgi:protease II
MLSKVRKHVVGTPQSSDTVVLEEKDRRFSVSICKSSDERFLIIQTLGERLVSIGHLYRKLGWDRSIECACMRLSQ